MRRYIFLQSHTLSDSSFIRIHLGDYCNKVCNVNASGLPAREGIVKYKISMA